MADFGKTQDVFDERLVTTLAVVVALAGTYLYFKDLALTGLTWDEWMDYSIALDFAKKQAFFTNLDDPSQGRFSHLVAAASFALFGESYVTFKAPFLAIGLLGGGALWWFLSRRVRKSVAALTAAMYVTCPYVLAASRTGATAGDAIVMVATLGFVITLVRWLESNRFWPYGVACGLICGMAIGAKWSCALLLPAVALSWLYESLRMRRKLFDGPVWTAVLAHQWLAVGLAVFASPTLMLGVPFVKSALAHSLRFTGMAMMQLGEVRGEAPWYYVPAVLISKYSLPQLAVLAVALFAVAKGLFKRRTKLGRVQLVCLVSMLPMAPLATKGFQNAHYYVATVPTVMILTALVLQRWLGTYDGSKRRILLWLAAGALCLQFRTSMALAPDYLLAGAQLGKIFNGQFAGPAVNHCQGLPFAVRELNRLVQVGGPRSAYVLQSCLAVMDHVVAHGPVGSAMRVSYFTPGPKPEHYVVIPASYDYDAVGVADANARAKNKAALLADCHRAGKPHVDFELWRCPARVGAP